MPLSNTENTMPKPPKLCKKESESGIDGASDTKGEVSEKPVNLLTVSNEIKLHHTYSSLQE